MGQPFGAKGRRAAWLVAGFCLMWHGVTFVQAGNLYFYTDAQGQAVLTDNLQQVPVEYRGRVRTMTGAESPASRATTSAAELAQSSPLPSSGVLQEILHAVAQKVHPIKGLTPHQTAVVIVAGVCCMALLLLMFLSPNPAIRLLSKCLLVLVSLTAVYQLAVGGPLSAGTVAGSAPQASGQAMDNIMGQVKSKTEQSYRMQDDRTTRQLDQAEQPTP